MPHGGHTSDGDDGDAEAHDRNPEGVARGAARAAQGGKGAHAARRRAGATAAGIALGADRQGLSVRRSRRPGRPGRPVRRPPPADRLPRLLRARRRGLARPWLRRLLDGRRPCRAPRPLVCPRHQPRVRLARAAGGHRPPRGADGLGAYPVVHPHRRFRPGLRGRRVARHQRLLPRPRQGERAHLPHLFHRRARRRIAHARE